MNPLSVMKKPAVSGMVVLLLALGIALPSWGDKKEEERQQLGIYHAGVNAYRTGRYKRAFRAFRQLAKKNIGRSQLMLAILYDEGKGAPQSDQMARKWYRKASEGGAAYAQYRLGQMYEKSRGPENKKNYAEAAKWYEKSAEQQYSPARYRLGEIYYKGLGVKKNLIRAHMWINLAASKGHPKSRKFLSEIEGKITRDQLIEARRLARKHWRPGVRPKHR